MRVSIVGSNRRLKSAVEEQEFRDYCHELGKLLVAEGCKVVINSDGKHTADYHVLMGMEQAQTSTEVTVYRRVRNDRTQPGRVEPIKMFPSPGLLKFVNIVVKGERNLNAAAYAASMANSDVLIVIAGADGADLAAQIAIALEKPVLPIAFLDGAGKDFYNANGWVYAPSRFTVPDEARDAVFTTKTSASAASTILLARALTNQDAFGFSETRRRLATRAAAGMLACTTTAILLWTALILLAKALGWFNNELIFFCLVFLSVFLGNVIRLGLQRGEQSREFFHDRQGINILMVNLLYSVIASFAFVLLFLLARGLVSPTGGAGPTAGAAGPAQFGSGDFERVAYTLSALGFAVGYLSEKAIDILQKKAESVLQF